MNKTLPELQAELERINAAIKEEKAMQKVRKAKINNKSMFKYFDLQQAYVNSFKGA
jgi:hypothetical protein